MDEEEFVFQDFKCESFAELERHHKDALRFIRQLFDVIDEEAVGYEAVIDTEHFAHYGIIRFVLRKKKAGGSVC